MAAATAPPESSWGDKRFSVAADCLSLILINDASGVDIPVADFTLSSVSAKFNAFGPTMTVYAAVGLTSRYYNNYSVSWEPMIEPFQLSVSLRQSPLLTHINLLCKEKVSASLPHLLFMTCHIFCVCGIQELNLNLSHAMIESVLSSLAVLQKSFSAESSSLAIHDSQETKFSPWRVINQTDVPMMIHCGSATESQSSTSSSSSASSGAQSTQAAGAASLAVTSPGVEVTVLPGEERHLTFPDDFQKGESRYYFLHSLFLSRLLMFFLP